jgi:excisionase family DNA binding protein
MLAMSDDQKKEWLTVRETAERLNLSEESVRRMIRTFQLPASRASGGARAPWVINAAALERQLEVDAHRRRVHEAGIVVGRVQEAGGNAVVGRGDDFAEELEQRYPDVRVGSPDGPTLAEYARATAARHELFDRIEREMAADPSVRQQLERLDEAERFEAEAQELARRVRRAERLRDRALEILDEDDQDD